MSNRERLRISFSMDKPQHLSAWEQLQSINAKQRSDYVIRCTLQAGEANRLEALIERVLDSRLRNGALLAAAAPPDTTAKADSLPASLRDFTDLL